MAKLKVRKKPTGNVAKTQADVDAANALAKRLMLKNNQRLVTTPIAVSKVGDALPEFINSATGKPDVAPPKKQLPLTVPSWVTLDDIKSEQGIYWYEDKNGDIVDVDPTVVQLPRFRKSPAEIAKTKVRVSKSNL